MNMNDNPNEPNATNPYGGQGETPQAPGMGSPPADDRPRVTRVPPRYQPYALEDQPKKSSGWKIFFVSVIVLFFLGLGFLGMSMLLFDHDNLAMLTGKDRIGLVRIEGAIYQGQEKEFWMSAIKEMAENDSIRGIVLRIDSPGGAVGASQELYSAIGKLRSSYQKPVYVSMGDMAASGGYYIASAADRIYALGGTLTGSIGVIFKKPQIGELAQKLGIDTEIVKSGRFKDSGSITRELTADERKLFENLIGDTYDQFVDDILKYRTLALENGANNMPNEKWADLLIERPEPLTARTFLRQIADGRVFTGRQAMQLGLVDEIGTLDDTIKALADELGLEGQTQIYSLQRKQSLRELLSSKLPFSLPFGNRSPLEYRMSLP